MKKVLSILCLFLMCASCNNETSPEVTELTPEMAKANVDYYVHSTIFFPEFSDSLTVSRHWDEKVSFEVGDTVLFGVVQNKEDLSFEYIRQDTSSKQRVLKTYKAVIRSLEKFERTK